MTAPQAVYVAAVVFYLVLFILFIRFFFWKWYADSSYWKRKPHLSIHSLAAMASRRGTGIPFFTVMVPARNEAEVIEKTIDHMSRLNYPRDRYEIIVVTDEKESIARTGDREQVIANAVECAGGLTQAKVRPQSRAVLIGLITRMCFKEFYRSDWLKDEVLSSKPLSELPPSRQQAIVRELATEIVTGSGRPSTDRMEFIVRRDIPGMNDEESSRVYPMCLSLAMPVVATYCRLRGDAGRVVDAMIRHAARASHNVTREILRTLTESISGVIYQQIVSCRNRNRLVPLLGEVHDACLPTTQDIVERKIRELSARQNAPVLKHATVPRGFDGLFPGGRLDGEVQSTKGRALNYGLNFLDTRTEMCGFYDAESRPDHDVLLYVAYRRLESGDMVKILQGPVFQVRNFYQMGAFCKIASLYQAIAHDWYLPALFRRLPFVGGTNLFLDRELLHRVGGFDRLALTEDLEIGTRAYLQCGAWPEYLPYYSTEQTPPSLQAFFRQRLRWGTGHLQVMDKIRRDSTYPGYRKKPLLRQLFIKGQMEWVVYQGATLVPPAMMTLWYAGMMDPFIAPLWLRVMLNAFSLVYFSFTIYAYHRYSPYLDAVARPRGILRRALVVLQLCLLPFAAFFFPLPYSSALVLKRLNRHPKSWAKTPRTRE